MTTPAQNAMPSTRGTNFYLADGNLERLCAVVMDGETFARARPHLIAMGEVAGGELDAQPLPYTLNSNSESSPPPRPPPRWKRVNPSAAAQRAAS